MIRGAKSIAEYAVRKWLEECFDTSGLKLTMKGNKALVEDETGDTLALVYDSVTKSVYINE